MDNYLKSSQEDWDKQEYYKKDLYWLKQDFLEDNKENIRSFLTNYYCRPYQRPTEYEKGLENFCSRSYDNNSNPTTKIMSKVYSFTNLQEYLNNLFNINYFKKHNVTILGLFDKFQEEMERELRLNIDPFAPKKFIFSLYFDEGTISRDGLLTLYKQKSIVKENLLLEDFIRGYVRKEYIPTNFEFIPYFNPNLNNPISYWDYLNESIYAYQNIYTQCGALSIWNPQVNSDSNTFKKNVYINTATANLYCFKALYNCILSKKFRRYLAKEYVDSHIIYSEDKFREVYGESTAGTIQAIKEVPDEIKVLWTEEEILSFVKSSIKGSLGIELLLTPFMLYKFIYFSKQKVFVNFNKYGIWEEYPKSKDNIDFKLVIRNIVDIMFSINLSDLDYHGISSKAIISNLSEKILSCLDFYKNEASLEEFIQTAVTRYINFKDFIFDLNSGQIFFKCNISHCTDLIQTTYSYTNYTLNDTILDINISNLFNKLNFYRYIDVSFAEFDINQMDLYLSEHFEFDPKSEVKQDKHTETRQKFILNNYKLCCEKFTKIYCHNNQEEDTSSDQLENGNLNSDTPITNSFEEFLKSEPFTYFLADDNNDSKFLENPLSDNNILTYFKNQNFKATNQLILDAYTNFCKNNNLEIESSIEYKKDGKPRDLMGKSQEFHKKLTNYFKEKNYFFNHKDLTKNENPNLLEDNIRSQVPVVLKDSDGTERCYLGFCLKPLSEKNLSTTDTTTTSASINNGNEIINATTNDSTKNLFDSASEFKDNSNINSEPTVDATNPNLETNSDTIKDENTSQNQ